MGSAGSRAARFVVLSRPRRRLPVVILLAELGIGLLRLCISLEIFARLSVILGADGDRDGIGDEAGPSTLILAGSAI